MQTIAETPEYIRRAEKLLSDDERRDVLQYLAAHPRAGDLMEGTGGVRKLRWARGGRAKSGGVRVIYYFHSDTLPLYLLTLFAKNERANLSKAERNALADPGGNFGSNTERGVRTMGKAFESIKQGLQEAIAHARGETNADLRVYRPHPIDVKALRARVAMTQEQFAARFGFSVATLRHWERGDRAPQGPALVLLNVIEKDPRAALNALAA